MLSCLTKRKNKAVFPYPLHEKNALFHSFFHKKHENGPFFIFLPFSRSNRPKEKKSGSTRTFFLKRSVVFFQRSFASYSFQSFRRALPAIPSFNFSMFAERNRSCPLSFSRKLPYFRIIKIQAARLPFQLRTQISFSRTPSKKP